MSISRRQFNRLSILASGAAMLKAHGSVGRESIGTLYDSADATTLAALVRQGDVSAAELLEEAIRRTELINPTINAVSQKHYDFARQAIRDGLPSGPFSGVPFLLKDLGVGLTGTITSHGSRLHGAEIARHTSTLVKRYQRAGLVIFGKTISPEYGAALTTENLFLGDCRNPWNLDYSTGGSSGGAAAAVVAGILPVAHATDGGGSIRVPANHCGVFGFKPTRGLTPGAIGPGMSVGHVVTRSVRDSAAMLDATAGYEPGAPYGAINQPGGYLAATKREPGRLVVALNLDESAAKIHPDCRAAVERTANLLKSQGHEIVEATPPIDFDKLNAAQNVLIATGIAARLDTLEQGRETPIGIPDIEPMTEMIRRSGNQFGPLEYANALQEMHSIGHTMGRFMIDHDVILQPVTATPAPRLKSIIYRDGDTLESYTKRFKQVSAFTHLYNMTGQPSMSLPLAFSSDGLPIGVMLSGRVAQDTLLFSLAAQIEATPSWRMAVPPNNAFTHAET